MYWCNLLLSLFQQKQQQQQQNLFRKKKDITICTAKLKLMKIIKFIWRTARRINNKLKDSIFFFFCCLLNLYRERNEKREEYFARKFNLVLSGKKAIQSILKTTFFSLFRILSLSHTLLILGYFESLFTDKRKVKNK